jgi:molybdopterin synthase catalytic subunit
MIRVQQADFDVGAEIAALRAGRTDLGAIVTFTGLVRDTAGSDPVLGLFLEHYPDMTERELERIEQEAHARWPLEASLIVHRHGALLPGDNIVLVITASAHRRAAFESAEFIMDFLKTSAPFWKREDGPDGGRWVSAKADDDLARARWEGKDKPDAQTLHR